MMDNCTLRSQALKIKLSIINVTNVSFLQIICNLFQYTPPNRDMENVYMASAYQNTMNLTRYKIIILMKLFPKRQFSKLNTNHYRFRRFKE